MMGLRRKLILFSSAFLFAACANKPVKPQPAASDKQQAVFDEGMRALEAQNYQDAASIFDNLLLQHPGTELDLVTLYNSGAAYEGLGDCKKAEDRYRQLIRSSAGKFKRFENEAGFRLSLMYECLGSDTKTVTSLLDIRRRGGKDLNSETLATEIPARLAAAYNRLGNREKALLYFNEASRGLKIMVARGSSKAQFEQLTRALFVMGRLNPAQRRGEVNPETFLPSLAMQQPYLLQALEMHIDPYSSKAEDDLRTAYNNVLRFDVKDAHARRELLTRALQTMNELRNIRMPKPDKVEDGLFNDLAKIQLRVQNELAAMPLATPLTGEAEKREGLKRQGHIK